MTTAADLLLTNGRIHPLTDGHDPTDDEPIEAVAVRDGRIVRLDTTYEVEFLAGVETEVIDLEGRTVLPGFVDAHTHMEVIGQYEREADLTGADSPEACLDRLDSLRADRGDGDNGSADDEWLLGFGYDESTWGGDYLTRDQLDEVSTGRPVVAYREDMHVASVNSVVLDRLRDEMPDGDVRASGGEPTGVLVEDAVTAVRDATSADPERTREYLLAAQAYANRRGVTTVHDMVRNSHAPRVYRDLDNEGDLTLRVRLNYWRDHLDAVLETGLRTNHGSGRVRVGGIKTFTDGSLGGRTARLSEPYADAGAGDTPADERGDWVVDPGTLADLVERVDDAGLQMTVHAIGDEAIAATLDAYEGANGERHRVEHAEVLTDELIDRLAAADVVVSAQPNFLKWAREDGLYADRLGDERRLASNRFGALRDAGATLAFGSDCMPLDPLFGIDQVVDAPAPDQRLSVTEALRAYTAGSAYAGFDEDRLGTLEAGTCADFAVLAESPWETDDVADIDVEMTVVDGDIVYNGRE
jgi:predicted amidohydrolase YtcJ